VDDPYGARLISLSSSYTSNPYILAASLADVNRWPELAMPSSPQLTDDETERPSGFPGASRLKYTQTIMGSKSGAIGLRVSGRRSSALKRSSGTPHQEDVKNFLSDNSFMKNTNAAESSVGERGTESWTNVPELAKTPFSVLSHSQVSAEESPSTATDVTPQVTQFVPRFKGASEMEARRRMRMLARRGHVAVDSPPPQAPITNPEPSPSSSEMIMDDDEDFDDMAGSSDSGDDEFDP